MYLVSVRKEKGGREGRGLRAVNYNCKPAKKKADEVFSNISDTKPLLFEGFNEAEKSELCSTKSARVGNMIQEF